MKLKPTYYRTSEGWGFALVNGKTRTVSEGYRTRAQAVDAVKDIKQGIRKNQNKT